jgi:hypothetical protein
MRFYTQQQRFYCGIDLHASLLAISGPAGRIDRPSGGTEEFLERRAARPGSRRAQAKGTLAESSKCVWCRQREPTVIAMTEARGAATTDAGS